MCISPELVYGLENSKQLLINDNSGGYLLIIVFLCYFVVLSDPAKRFNYDLTGICEIEKYSLQVFNLTILVINYLYLFVIVLVYCIEQ